MNGSTLSVHKTGLPKVVIVGRPNVGKSTLFNRILKQRRAITDPLPGVTRDPVETVGDVSGKKVLLIDTGGFKLETEELDDLVVQKSIESIEKADLILLVMDVTEITGEDEAFIEYLRRWSEKIILVINKVDNEKRDQDIWNFGTYGFEIIGISAGHGRNMEELLVRIGERLKDHVPEDSREESITIRLAIIGKPNTGKSTLTNYLTQSNNSIVSSMPGTTRDVIEGFFSFKGMAFRVLDTAGIRRKTKVSENIEYYSVNRAIKTLDQADIVFLLIDAEEGLSDQDKKIASLAVKRGRGIILVLNKWDKMETIRNRFEAVQDRIRFLFPVLAFAPVMPTSAINGEGVPELLEAGVTIWDQLHREIATGKLNQAVERWQHQYSPPMAKNKSFRYKARYMTQKHINPVKFILFVNKKRGFPPQYLQYIKNNLRKEFGYSSIPLEIEVREG